MEAENDAEREERLVACLNILRRMPTEDAEEVRLQDAHRRFIWEVKEMQPQTHTTRFQLLLCAAL
jgi:hypothetical protein